MQINQKLSVRANIILTLEKINEGQSLSLLLDELLNNVKDNEKAFAHELLFGTLRHWFALNRIGESLIKNQPSDIGVGCTLNMGLYELIYMNTPDYAVINETLNALKVVGKNYGTGLINAILRKVADNKDKFAKKVAKNHSLPNWLAKQLKQDWGDFYEVLGQNLRETAPIFLRINPKFCSAEQYSKILQLADIPHQIISLNAQQSAICLLISVKITHLPHFYDGWLSVQDLNAQLAMFILQPILGKFDDKPLKILDACTAPGGKLAHLLEMFHMEHNGSPKNVQITALDISQGRLNRVRENLDRLKLSRDNINLVCDDMTQFNSCDKFDVIILDAPCTATGVIRRHPDINLLRQSDDVINTVQLQRQILDNCWQNLSKNGYLLYITCSILKDENERQIIQFLNTHSNAKAVTFELTLPNQIKQKIGYQCLPLDNNDGDGFYYALLQKTIA